MKKIVIFDDSISYFTNPSHIQTVYGQFWDEGIPISLAITPALQSGSQPHKVSNNGTLCRYLNVMAEQRLVEICIHGYNGTLDEFKSEDDILLGQKIEEGKAELEHALPDADIGTFVIPETKYSKTAKNLLTEYDFRLCVPQKPSDKSDGALFITKDLTNDRKLFTYSHSVFSDTTDTKALAKIHTDIQNNDLVIIRQHYAKLYDNTGQPNALFQQWQLFLEELLSNKHLEFDTFMFV